MITNYVFCFNDIKQKQCLGSWRICTTCMNRNVDNARTPKHMSDKSTLKQQKCCFKFQQTNKQTNTHATPKQIYTRFYQHVQTTSPKRASAPERFLIGHGRRTPKGLCNKGERAFSRARGLVRSRWHIKKDLVTVLEVLGIPHCYSVCMTFFISLPSDYLVDEGALGGLVTS